MPGVIGNRECITTVRREWHLRFLRFSAGGEHLVKDGADMWRRIVGRQIELHRDAFPKAVSMLEDAVSWNIPGQNRHRIHLHLFKVRSEPAFQARREPPHESRLHFFRAKNAARLIPHSSLRWRQMTNVFG